MGEGTTGGLGRVAATLGVPEETLAPLAAYDEVELQRLDELVRAALSAEDRAFEAGLEEALRFVPRLLRGAAKGLLFPGGGRG